jgi:hypothetical protein
MEQPLFKVLTREQFNRLAVEDRVAYMQSLMAGIRRKLEETRRQLETTKGLLADRKHTD